ncbi:hypothetical protein T265_15643, partial [Opisthorchis viverrini]
STVGLSVCADFRAEPLLGGRQQRCFRKYRHANSLGEAPYCLHIPITDDSTTLPSDCPVMAQWKLEEETVPEDILTLLLSSRLTPITNASNSSSPVEALLSGEIRLSVYIIRPASHFATDSNITVASKFNLRHHVANHLLVPGQYMLTKVFRIGLVKWIQGCILRRTGNLTDEVDVHFSLWLIIAAHLGCGALCWTGLHFESSRYSSTPICIRSRPFVFNCVPPGDSLTWFVSNLQIELLRVEFDHFSASQQSLSPSELAQSVLRFARQKPELATKRLETVANSASLAGKTIGFEAYKSLFNFLYVIEDFSSALKMFAIAKHSISKEEFQRAARAVTGSFLDPILVDTLFILFDSDGDGHLSYHEFIETIRARGIAGAQFTRFSEGQVWLLSRVVVINEYLSSLANCQLCSLSRQPLVHTIQNMVHMLLKNSTVHDRFRSFWNPLGGRSLRVSVNLRFYLNAKCTKSANYTHLHTNLILDPALRFSYWPRYVARLLRFRAVYRKELLGWKLQTEQPFERPDKKPNEYREDAYLPIWRFSEAPPWNIANRISEFPYPDTDWCVVLPDGKKVRKTLKPMLPEEQLIFKGDRVKILVGPDKGKVGLVSSVLKMRRMVIVDGLNYRLSAVTADDIRREELPLCLDTEIALVDPVDGKPCQPSWRYDDKGNRVRVSLKTGRIIPLPMSARILDDLTDPKAAIRGPKDTPASVVTRVTFNPANDSSKISFEEDLSVQFGLDTTKKPFPTFWY